MRTTVSSDWRTLKDQIERAFADGNTCRHGLWLDQTALVIGYGEAALAKDLKRLRCDPLGGNWTRLAIAAVWIGRPLDGLKYPDRIEALRGQDRDVMHARILAYLGLGKLSEGQELFEAGDFRTADVPEAMSLLALQIPAAAGSSADWKSLRAELEHDPGQLLVGAAVFGDRVTANRAATEIDAMTLGPEILLRDGNLPWSPPAAIMFPLKSW